MNDEQMRAALVRRWIGGGDELPPVEPDEDGYTGSEE